jgi:succinate dehydrogenase/fumarate reductase flavoprotein subunit
MDARVTVTRWDQEVDVVVVGSGGAGLTAAVLARDHGADVFVLERSGNIGGTTAVSGGGVWIPLNHHMGEVGVRDSREAALSYCRRLAAGRSSDELIETFVDTGHEMVRYLEEHTPLRFDACALPDYQSEREGAKSGRTLEPQLFPARELGEWAGRLRPSPLMFVPLRMEEAFAFFTRPLEPPVKAIVKRMEEGLVGSGNALIAALLKACLDRGITFSMDTRARRLIQEEGRVVGVRAERDESEYLVRARGGVVLACGGFEWDPGLWSRFMAVPITHRCSPPYNEGDGLVMAAELGADLANMGEAWLYPGAVIPGEEHEGLPVSRWVMGERTLPHTILVNRRGRRFVNEGANYNDMSKGFNQFDPNTFEYQNLPCWAIFDHQYREKYAIMTMTPADPDPDWLSRDDTLSGLAGRVGIDPDGLTETVSRFNGFAREGRDRDFGRGESAYEHWMGDATAPHPNLGTIEQPPFYALPVHLAAAGTKGGPRTNAQGQVLAVRGSAIPGLYAAGNAMAGVSGPGYYGGGGTIGLGMTWGYICGRNAAREAKTGSRATPGGVAGA